MQSTGPLQAPTALKEENPFYMTNNKQYGTQWQSADNQGLSALTSSDIPQYRDIGDRSLALKNSKRTYKHEVLKEMRARGELDTQVYEKIEANKKLIKMPENDPRQFPAKSEEIKYPEQALKVGNPLFSTSNMHYGSIKPNHVEMPSKYFPRPEKFTNTFPNQFADTGLNTSSTPSRVHAMHDK